MGDHLNPFDGIPALADAVLGQLSPALVAADPPGPSRRDVPTKVRVYRVNRYFHDGRPCWRWQCNTCNLVDEECLHKVLHTPGSWSAAFCSGLQHVHRWHPRPTARPGDAPHTVLGGRRRCDWSAPTPAQRAFATYVLCGRTGYPGGPLARETAREILALAGIRTPGSERPGESGTDHG